MYNTSAVLLKASLYCVGLTKLADVKANLEILCLQLNIQLGFKYLIRTTSLD